MNKIYQKRFVTFGIILLSFMGAALPARADEVVLSISNNGEGSNNTAAATTHSDTTVQQNNTAAVDNNVNSQANTGDNSANNNNGNSTVSTGDTNTQTRVTNTDVNSNAASAGTEHTSTQTIISNNGENSINTVTTTVTNTTSVRQNNIANISNIIAIHANTGNNDASHNNGAVSIDTGNIKAKTTVTNSHINESLAAASDCNCIISSFNKIVVSGNGEGSINNVLFNLNNSTTLTSNNLADILNFISHDLNTGGNTADHNNGDVAIKTGDVDSTVTVNNDHINSNIAQVDCGCKPTPPPPPPPPPPPGDHTNPPSNPGPNVTPGGTGGSSPTPGNVLGATIGEILPATGSFFMLWATIASLILFFSGWYLRFRSGCAPGRVC